MPALSFVFPHLMRDPELPLPTPAPLALDTGSALRLSGMTVEVPEQPTSHSGYPS
ncbi:hypothetical protein [Pseudovibrio ascidiaceicola]|uniref:hypothetical protein n=1 Tax=Pseudovibrio ascidiaceicola TaxID=285279 RepID=UPI001AD940D3|nr:hypothetical protein [Pseudovibrio ascidiaceicola]